MGRLNYTNRKIDGVKLGQVVAKDLTKRIPPALGSKAALRDPVVEIDLRSKQLGDAGFLEVATGLAKSIQHGGPQGSKVVLLEELCLGDNRLTVASLQHLTPIIELVAEDLRDLDLSNNAISVNDPDDVLPWEAFLQSLSKCCVLRRLDLSGNELGTKAFEVLARVYAREEPVDLVLPEELQYLDKNTVADRAAALEHMTQTMSLTSESEDMDSAEEHKTRPKSRKEKISRYVSKSLEKGSNSPEKNGHIAIRTGQLLLCATAKGLHSIPYIVLSDTSMNDSSALYLSYILVNHHTPDRLLARVPPAKAGLEQQQLTAYDETQCQGIIYLPNCKMDKEGKKVLDLAEKERLRLAEPMLSRPSSENLYASVNPTKILEHTTGSSRQSGLIITRKYQRRTSGSAGGYLGSSGTSAQSMSDLDRARSRIQGEELERTGQYGNDLWRIALNMLCLCREIQLPPKKETPQTTQHLSKADAADPSLAREFPPLLPPSPPKPRGPIIKTLDVPGFPSRKAKTLATLLPLGNGNPNQAMSPRSTHSRKASVTGLPDIPTARPPTPSPISPRAKIAMAVARASTKPYRSKLPCGFSKEMWWKILGQASGAQGILSETQQKSVLDWAMDKNTLRRGREWLGEREGNQIWHVLDGIGCLAYELDTQ